MLILGWVFMLSSETLSAQGSGCFVHARIRYPVEASEKGIQGTIKVELVRDSNCIITTKSVVDGLGYGLDEEALRLINDKTEICLMRGRRYCSDTLVVPIRFNL